MSNDKLKLLGQWVRMQIGGHAVSVVITDYNLSNDTYHGELHRNYSMNSDEKTPVVQSVHGIRKYPYDVQPHYAFQYVRPGEDEQPLLDIADWNAKNSRGEQSTEPHVWNHTPQEPKPTITPVPRVLEDVFEPADVDHSGKVTNEERKKYNREQGKG